MGGLKRRPIAMRGMINVVHTHIVVLRFLSIGRVLSDGSPSFVPASFCSQLGELLRRFASYQCMCTVDVFSCFLGITPVFFLFLLTPQYLPQTMDRRLLDKHIKNREFLNRQVYPGATLGNAFATRIIVAIKTETFSKG